MSGSDKETKALNKLRRLPENRICPNCLREDSMGFTAVCVPFKTFICSECKSAHQSFSHRVKSTAMSTWTMEEVKALDEKNGGGNRLARELWLATMPENERPNKDSGLEVIKRFVEKAYIDERWKTKETGAPSIVSEVPATSSKNSKERSGSRKAHSHKKREKGSHSSKREGPGNDAWAPAPGFSPACSSAAPTGNDAWAPAPGFSPACSSAAPTGWGAADFGAHQSNPLAQGPAWGMPAPPSSSSRQVAGPFDGSQAYNLCESMPVAGGYGYNVDGGNGFYSGPDLPLQHANQQDGGRSPRLHGQAQQQAEASWGAGASRGMPDPIGAQACIDLSGRYTQTHGDEVVLTQSGSSGQASAGWEYTVRGSTATIIGHGVTGQITGSVGLYRIAWSNGVTYEAPAFAQQPTPRSSPAMASQGMQSIPSQGQMPFPPYPDYGAAAAGSSFMPPNRRLAAQPTGPPSGAGTPLAGFAAVAPNNARATSARHSEAPRSPRTTSQAAAPPAAGLATSVPVAKRPQASLPSSPPPASLASTAGKEPLTLHPTNPWAEVLGAKLIQIEPTNPWADVVPSSCCVPNSFARDASLGRLPVPAELGSSTPRCASQQASIGQQANQWVY